MLYNLLVPLTEIFAPFNLLSYLTFRSGAALITALAISLLFGARFIAFLKRHQTNGQPIRDDGPDSHQSKQGTPTMGGVLLLVALVVSLRFCGRIGATPMSGLCSPLRFVMRDWVCR